MEKFKYLRMFDPENEVHKYGCIVELDGKISSKIDLMNAISDGLRFPEYFGKNWDSLYDMFCDLSWIKEKNVTILHRTLPNICDEDLASYIKILSDCVKCWNFREDHNFYVLFSSDDRKIIDKLLLS